MQATGALVLVSAVIDPDSGQAHRQLLETPQAVGVLTACMASTGSEMVYNLLLKATYALSHLNIHVPPFRPRPVDLVAACCPQGRDAVVLWNEDQVADWVRAQRFAMYEQNFRDGWVDGDLLLQLDDECLAGMGIAQRTHRLHILREIGRLHESVSMEAAAATPGHDVFISYRRSNGSWLAQLIKVHLLLQGYTVVLQ